MDPANTHDGGLGRDPRPMMIVPQAQVTDGMTALNARIVPLRWVVRTHGDPHEPLLPFPSNCARPAAGFP
jgi:hypothetical protein